jgi:hypothetical protein
MATRLDEPLLTVTLERDQFDCVEGAVYIYGSTNEQRSAVSDDWSARQLDRGVTFVEVVDQLQPQEASLCVNGITQTLMLTSSSQTMAAVDTVHGAPVYIDITGLSHHVTAPLLRAAVKRRGPLHVVYMEPGSYRPSQHPQRGAFYDLSDRIDGIRPLPGFAYIRPNSPEAIFVPLLGFEGARFEHVVRQVEPAMGATFPIIGVPGFRADYPFIAYWGNEASLLADDTYLNLRYAIANDPFDLFHHLADLRTAHPNKLMKIAPIGTKPHAIGAFLFAISKPNIELIYDHPIRKSGRTNGVARLCVYDVGAFVGSDLFVVPGK